jgi:hypothetical protein
MKKDARRKPNMTCGCNHKRANLAALRDCEEEKDVEGEERIRGRTSARLHAGDIDQRNQIQQTAHSGAGYKFDDEEQAGVYGP